MQNQECETRIGSTAILFMILFTILWTPGGAVAAEIWSDPTPITVLYPNSGSRAFNTAYSHPQSTCDNGTRFEISMANPNYDVLVSSLLAAFYSGKTIRMNFAETGPRCAVIVNRFFVYP